MTREDEIAFNLTNVRENIAKIADHQVTLVVVTKTYPTSDVQILHNLGVRDFGENRNHEGAEKSIIVPGVWHFQGQIQSNKIASITNWSSVVHSLDDQRHFQIIEKVALHPLSIFLQVSLDGATGRGGVELEDLFNLAKMVDQSSIHTLAGLMSVPPLGMEPSLAYSRLSVIQSDFLVEFPHATGLSIGMSHDYQLAISNGATHVRIGSSILGSRKTNM